MDHMDQVAAGVKFCRVRRMLLGISVILAGYASASEVDNIHRAKPTATSISLTAALQNPKCQVKYRTGPSSDAWGLYIGPNTPCSNVTVGAADATFTAESPLRPVVVEQK